MKDTYYPVCKEKVVKTGTCMKNVHKVRGYTYMFFSAIFTKYDNFCDFLFASLEDEAVQKFGQPLKGRICS